MYSIDHSGSSFFIEYKRSVHTAQEKFQHAALFYG